MRLQYLIWVEKCPQNKLSSKIFKGPHKEKRPSHLLSFITIYDALRGGGCGPSIDINIWALFDPKTVKLHTALFQNRWTKWMNIGNKKTLTIMSCTVHLKVRMGPCLDIFCPGDRGGVTRGLGRHRHRQHGHSGTWHGGEQKIRVMMEWLKSEEKEKSPNCSDWFSDDNNHDNNNHNNNHSGTVSKTNLHNLGLILVIHSFPKLIREWWLWYWIISPIELISH